MSLMPPIKSLIFKRHLRLVLLILFFSKIILSYSYYIEKRLSYITILALIRDIIAVTSGSLEGGP